MVNAGPGHDHQAGLTAIEMIVVIVIISLLAGLILSAIAIVSEQQKPWSTRNTMRTVMNLLAARSAVTGGYPSAIEHPLAGSAINGAGRPLFLRAAGGNRVATTGEALMVADPTWVPGADGRVLRSDDRFDGIEHSKDLPLLFGLGRSHCTVLGGSVGVGDPVAIYPGITNYRRLDRPMPGRTTLPGEPDYTRTTFPDPQHLVSPPGEDGSPERSLEIVQRRALEIAIGTGGLDELRRLRCVQEYQGTQFLGHRAMVLDQESATQPTWAPGMYQRVDARWQRYRLRGPVLVDGWRREILYRNQPTPGLFSAGKDGVFVCDPGPDGIISSNAATADTIRSGDDRNGMTDNLTTDTP